MKVSESSLHLLNLHSATIRVNRLAYPSVYVWYSFSLFCFSSHIFISSSYWTYSQISRFIFLRISASSSPESTSYVVWIRILYVISIIFITSFHLSKSHLLIDSESNILWMNASDRLMPDKYIYHYSKTVKNAFAIFFGFCALILGFAYVEENMNEKEERFFNTIANHF